MDPYLLAWKTLKHRRILATISWLGWPPIGMILVFFLTRFIGDESEWVGFSVFLAWIPFFTISRHRFRSFVCPRCGKNFFKHSTLRSNCCNCGLCIGDSLNFAADPASNPPPIYRTEDGLFTEMRIFGFIFLAAAPFMLFHSISSLIDSSSIIMVNGMPSTDHTLKSMSLIFSLFVALFGLVTCVYPVKIMNLLFGQRRL